ncbi:beta-ketoacyl synthase-like protein [Lentzea atacamensis]|uniref:Beta-ketoacyl synthase-like protein n=1 Tax=Lentzea atacamensis TaxID=531938 RepID=A0ABX9EHL4_9PSEU|nr:beta-ketoacyl synthase-like protein [Lentzea atacamensis]
MSPADFAGRTVLVTGGGKGVGRAISRAFARRGAHVIINYFHSGESAAHTLEAIVAEGGSAELIRASVSKPDAITEMFGAVDRAHGGLDVLVNNAARGVLGPCETLTEQDWQRGFDTNVHGARRCALAAAPLMRRRGGGAIVNVSSIGAGMALANYMLVGVSKAALEGLTRYLAADLGPGGIRVNTASAGVLDNPTAHLFPGARALHETCSAAAPLADRLGSEEELADLVVFLASDQASWVTGQVLLADGGLSLGRAMLAPGTPRPEPRAPRAPQAPGHQEDATIAIVGMGLRVPGAADPEEFWNLLLQDTPVFSEPGDRFDLDTFWSTDPRADGKTYSRVAGYITAHDDHLNDGDYLSCWLRHSLLQARAHHVIRPTERVGCFIGAYCEGSQHVEQSLLVAAATHGIAEHWPTPVTPELRASLNQALRARYRHATGSLQQHLPYAAARAALPQDCLLQIVDTACSSSLYAVDLGVKSLVAGECDVAFCGGAFSLGPHYQVLFARLGGLSHRGAVRSFDRDADGVLFSDGAGLVMLKRLDRARADGDRVLAVLAGFGGASDGRGKAIYAPNPAGHLRAVHRARAVSSVPPEHIDWIVAHGTGTRAGDEAELRTLGESTSDGEYPCTSNKSLIGHTGWAAGVVSLIHAVQGLQHSKISAQRCFQEASRSGSHIPTCDLPLPERPDRPRTVGISALGFGGTNAHLLVQDAPKPGMSPPRSTPRPATDPVVVVGWSAHLPGGCDRAEVARRLANGLAPAVERSFSEPYPPPSHDEVPLPPATISMIDRSQLMAMQVARRFIDENGELWVNVRETTGVIAAHTAVPAGSADRTVRTYAADLTAFASTCDTLPTARLSTAVKGFLDEVQARCAPASENTLAGQMPNVIPARIANIHDLHGPTMVIDTGITSGRDAITVASRYLGTAELDLALVLGVNSGSDPLFADAFSPPGRAPAQGAFLIGLARESVARRESWPILAPLPDLPATPSSEPGGTTYLAADDVVELLRQITRTNTLVIPTATTTSRHVPRWRVSAPVRSTTPLDADPRHTVVITTGADAPLLEPAVQAAGSRLLVVRPDQAPEETVRPLHDEPVHHLRVVGSLHHAPAWPALAEPELLALQETTFLAVRDHRDTLDTGGSLGVVVRAPFHREAPHPHTALFGGLVKSMVWELPGCRSTMVITDDDDAMSAWRILADEMNIEQGMPVVAHRGGRRYVQHLHPATATAGELPLKPGAVVVATGGARGITSAVVTSLARRAPLRLWLLGSSHLDSVPEELLRAREDELPSHRAAYLAGQREQGRTASVRELNRRFDTLLHARESLLTLNTLRDLCGPDNVHFITCDVTDRTAVHHAAAEVYSAAGEVHLLINGAGVHHAGRIERKSLTGARRIRDVKLLGYHHLREAFTNPAPRLWCNFGSIAGLVGLPGESDYGPANDFLSAAASASEPGTGEFTICWPIWDTTGLGAASGIGGHTAGGRLSRISTREGVDHFLTELSARQRAPVSSLLGHAEHRSIREQFPGHLVAEASVGHFLGTPDTRRPDRMTWPLVLDLGHKPYLRNHTVHGRPTVPGMMLTEIAVEAATMLLPGHPLRALRDIRFSAFVTARTGPVVYEVTATHVTSNVVTVTVCSHIAAPDGQRHLRDREHFRATVQLGDSPAPPATPPAPTGQLMPDPFSSNDSTVRVTGIFDTTRDWRQDDTGLHARWHPSLDGHEELDSLAIPSLLLDGLIRTAAVRPTRSGLRNTAVPVSVEQLTVYTTHNDRNLAQANPTGINLSYQNADDSCTAYTPAGLVLARLDGVRVAETTPA